MRTLIGIGCLAIAATAPLFTGYAFADTVELRDGTLVQGKYVGGTAGTIRMEAADGVKVLETANVLALTFSSSGAAPTTAPSAAAAQPTAQPAAAAVAAPTSVQVPAGTVLTVKLDGPVSSKDPEGKKFSGKLLADLAADGKTVAKAGSAVYGQVDKSKQAGRLVGKSELAFSLSGVDMSGRIQPIVNTNFSEKGKGEFRKTARNTAGGALIGHAIDDDGGAGAGAAVGAGISLIKKGDAVTAPAGMILEFRLTQPFQATTPQ
jgi:hypothetical protein